MRASGKKILGLCLFGVLIFGDWALGQIRIPPAVSTTTWSSAVSEVASQPTLYCRGGHCQTAQAWQRQDLEERARSRGNLRHTEQLNHGCDGNCIAINQSMTDWVPKQQPDRPAQPIPLRTVIALSDQASSLQIRVDTNTAAGQSLTQEVSQMAGLAAPAVMNFVERQSHLNQVRERFQQHYQTASQAGRQYVEDLRNYSRNLHEQARTNRQETLLGATSALVNLPLTQRTQAERSASEAARALSQSALRTASYEMNSEGATLMGQALEQAIQSRNWEEASRLLEALTYGTIDESPISSNMTQRYSNGDGVLKVGGPFDDHRFATKLKSNDGQIVRRLANRYQSLWQQTNQLEVLTEAEVARYAAGALALSIGDIALADGNLGAGASLLRASEVISESFSGFAVGFGESLNALVDAVPQLTHLAQAAFDDPENAWAATVQFALNLDAVAGLMIEGLVVDSELLINGSAHDRGRIVGRYAIDVISVVASGGALSAAKAFASSGRGLSALAKESKLFSRISQTIPAGALKTAEHAAKRLDDIAHKIPTSAKAGLRFHAERNPELALKISQTYHKSLQQGRPATAQYLERVAASKQVLSQSVDQIANTHHTLRTDIKDLPRASRQGVFSRAVPKEVEVNGVKRTLTKANVFEDHPGLVSNEHRFTIGGELGHRGLYVTQGEISNVAHILAEETQRKISDLVFDSKKLSLDNLLDLTNPETLAKLKLSEGDFLRDSYDISQALGDVAKESGFRGIVFHSSKTLSPSDGIKAVNVVLFQ